jgi:16S rRNA (uracil1498-N3)-methyltransferase
MPATPAWPPASLPRLFVAQTLSAGTSVALEGAAANYLLNVLRLDRGERVKLFDDRTGEWLAEVSDVGRKRVTLAVGERLREREPVPDLWLLFAPIKRGRIDWLVEKATELGIARLLPVVTRRTIVDRLNLDRLRAHIVEAAEQCERTALTELAEPQKLDALLAAWPAERILYFADEAGGEPLRAASGPARRPHPPFRRRGRRRAVRARARPGRDPDRPRRRLYRRGAGGDPRHSASAANQPGPAHPARRHGGISGGRPMDGGGRRLELVIPGLTRDPWTRPAPVGGVRVQGFRLSPE